MNLKTSFVLMILFMGLGSIAFFDPFRIEEKKSREEEEEKQFFLIKEKIVHEISIKNGAKSVKLVCAAAEGCKLDGDASWKVASPVEDIGDTSAITTLANAVVNLRSIEKLPLDSPMDPKEFGFEQGKPSLEVRTKDGIFQLETGAPTAVGPNVYARKPGDSQTVYVVAAYFPQMLDKEIFHWRNKRIFPGLEPEKITELSWKGQISLKARKDKGKWQIEAPINVPANFIMMEGLASTLAYASAKAIQEKAPGKAELEIDFNGGKLLLAPKAGSPKGSARELIASAGGKHFVMDATPFDRFQKGMLEYRERRLFPDFTGLDEFELHFPKDKKRIQLKRQGEGWVAAGGEKPAEALSQERIKDLAMALIEGEASAFLPASNPGARQFKGRQPDLEVILPGGHQAHFVIAERKMALTEGVIPGEVRAFSGPFLAALPIRFEDLYASHNKLAPQLKKEEDEHGHDHSHHVH